MTLNYLTAMWSDLAPAMGNHLWQSTLFVAVAGLLTLPLRKNHARARYWLWLAASVKFLLPFSLLVGLGSHLAWTHASSGTNAGVYVAMEEFSRPFASTTMPVVSRTAATTALQNLVHLLPAFFVAAWLCGLLAVLFVWYMRWRRVSASVRESMPSREGREVDALRRVERNEGIRKPIETLLSRTFVEPGIFGIARPVLVWPEGISARLEDAHLQAILAHEVCHVRRRDNLAAAIHMLVEAIFWFYPLVWWLGARLVEERERACDEEVLESGTQREVYAESILKICEFCVGSPLACVSGVTGADLKKRIARIMTQGFARKLDFSRKLLLSAAGLLALALPIVFGLVNARNARAARQTEHRSVIAPRLEVVSIKPNKTGDPTAGFEVIGRPSVAIGWSADRFMATNFSLHMLIQLAYDVQGDQIVGGPEWMNSEKYDVDTKIEGADSVNLDRQGLFQELLADSFQLALHRETKDVPIYALLFAKRTANLQEAKPGDAYANGAQCRGGRPCGVGLHLDAGKNEVVGQGLPISSLVSVLSQNLGGRIVVDKTTLAGKYDFTLRLPPNANRESACTAVQEQLGLKLEAQTAPIEILVVDRAEKPDKSQTRSTRGAASLGAQYATWQAEAGGKHTFETASVKPNKSGNDSLTSMNVPMGPGDVYPANGGLFSGTNVPLISYIYFAYKLTGSQFQLLLPHLPKWVLTDRFDIEARASGNPTKDQMRLMVESLLAERFKLTIHYETQQLPAFALVLANPEKTGPHLQSHVDNPSCSTAPSQTTLASAQASPAVAAGGFPAVCGGIIGMPSSPSGRLRVGARNVPIGLLASSLAQMGNLDRAVLDRTGLSGVYDFTFEWTPQHNGPGTPQLNGQPPVVNESGPTFTEDLQEQLGLKLEPQTAPTEVLVVDNVERPSEN